MPELNPETLLAMKEAAEKATPGPWVIYRGRKYPHIKTVDGAFIQEFGQAFRRDADAQFIAIANPANVSALLAERDALVAEVERQAREIERLTNKDEAAENVPVPGEWKHPYS